MEGAPHMAKRITVVSMVCPPPPYIKEGGGEGRSAPRARPKRGILLGLQVLIGIHQEGEGGRKEEGEGKERGAPPPSPSPIRTQGGGRPAPPGPSSLPTKAHRGPLVLPGFPVTPSGTPVLSETLRNISDVRTTWSIIAIFMFGLFRDSSSCP